MILTLWVCARSATIPRRRMVSSGAAGTRCWPAFMNWLNWESTMTWETPTAIDLRFGMEITMYISNR